METTRSRSTSIAVLMMGVLLLVSATAQAAIHFSDDLADFAKWTLPSGTAVAGAGIDPDFPAMTVHANGDPGFLPQAVRIGGFDTDVKVEDLQSFTADYTLRINDNHPVNAPTAQYSLQTTSPGVDGMLNYAILTLRRIGTFQFEVFAFDAGLNSVKVVNAAVGGETFGSDEYLTLSVTRTSAGQWTVTRSDTAATIVDETESTLITSSNIAQISVRDFNRTGATESMAFHDMIEVTSVIPEPATMALLALGGLALVRRRQ